MCVCVCVCVCMCVCVNFFEICIICKTLIYTKVDILS